MSVKIDRERFEVFSGKKEVILTPIEFDLLSLLIAADGKVLSRAHFLEKVWGHNSDIEIETRTVDQHIKRLRAKLGVNAFQIRTVTNRGYKFKSA